MLLKCMLLVCSKTKHLATRVYLLVLYVDELAQLLLCARAEISSQSKEFSSQPGPAEFWFHFLGCQKKMVSYSCEFPFSRRGPALSLEMERVLLSIPWTDEVWIRPDIETSFLLKKHVNLCTIHIRILSNVTPVKIFSNPNRDYFR